ncbi:hypothetical protein KFE25_000009 [Diacronema lutheri]|uniref:Uncharacterized protein n=1 Tax=Diacronema lutheri TaxID=2081491 RepID=A0A8J5X8W9_DIALT|nr:hypothetical protein KFE25_000009 [Diacronema lutheri]
MPIAAAGVAATGLLSYIYMELRTYEKQIKGLDTKMETQIKGLDTKMEMQIKGLDQKINHLDQKMEMQIKGLDQKMDMLSETLSLKFDALNDFKTQLLIRMEKSEDRVDAQLRELVKRA